MEVMSCRQTHRADIQSAHELVTLWWETKRHQGVLSEKAVGFKNMGWKLCKL